MSLDAIKRDLSVPPRMGAHFVCFPENYPGPWRMPATYDPIPALAEAAAKDGIHAVFGTIEPIDARGGDGL